MRELLKVAVVAVAVLVGWFGYIYWAKPDAFAPRAHYVALMAVLEDYRREKGAYPVFDKIDVPVEQLLSLLKRSSVNLRSGWLKGVDQGARYVSVTGESYGLLNQSGQLVECIVEFRTSNTGW
jgi:hypothetical protein